MLMTCNALNPCAQHATAGYENTDRKRVSLRQLHWNETIRLAKKVDLVIIQTSLEPFEKGPLLPSMQQGDLIGLLDNICLIRCPIL